MTQYIIDIGAVPDDGQGDPLRTAFNYTNENFNQIFAAGPVLSNIQIGNNTITTTVLNSNLILSPSGIGRIQLNSTIFPRLDDVYDIGTPSLRFNSIYLGDGGLHTTGGITTSGNITADYFIGNGSQLTGIVATTGSQVVNGNSLIDIPAAGSNIFVTVNGTSNVVTFANTGAYIAGQVSATGNIAGNYILGNGALLTGINIGYGNSNVAEFLPTYTGNLVSLTGPVTTTANITGGNLRTSGQISATGNIIGGNINTGRLTAGYITTGTTVSAIGNITTNSYFIGDGSLLTGINANYGNANVAAFLPTYTGNLVSLTGPVTTTANVTGGNLRTSGQILASGNITSSNLDTGKIIAANINAANITSSGLVSAAANITTGAYFIGDGSQLTNLPAGNYSNANVAAFLPTYTGSMPGMTGLLRTTGNIIGGNIYGIGNILSGNVDTGLVSAGNIIVSGPISAVGNVTGDYIQGNGAFLTGINVNYSNANVAAFLPTYTGNLPSLTGLLKTTANIEGANISIVGNITGGNVDTGRVNAGNITISGSASATGNITTSAYFIGDGSQLTNLPAGNYSNANVAAFLPTYTGNLVSLTGPVTTTANVTGGNLRTTGQISATGNITGGNVDTGKVIAANIVSSGSISAIGNVTGNYFIGDGSQLTNLPAGNYSNANVAAFLPTYTGNLVSLTGPVTTTANVTGGNLQTAGNITGGNVNTGKVIAANIVSSGPISATANISTGAYFIGDGSQLTNLPAGNYSNANVAAFLPTYTGNLVSLAGPVTTTANITGGNLRTAGNITGGNVDAGRINANSVTVAGPVSASGNITGVYFIGDGSQLTNLPAGNYSNANVAAFLPTYTGNLVSLTGPVTTTANITGGNLQIAGQISAIGNITGGNVDTTKLTANNILSGNAISAVGNISGNNLIGNTVTATTVTAIANVVAGNVTTTGQVSATGNIQGGNLNAPGGTVTSYIVSATGRIQGANFVTSGYVTAVGNITGGNVDTGNLHAGNIAVDNIVSAVGNVYGNNFVGRSLSVTGNVSAGNVSISGAFGAATLSASGNITGGNILTTGLVSSTGNISGNYFIGNGSLLTGITVSGGTSISNGNSNVVVSANSNVGISVGGVSNVAKFTTTGVAVNGAVSATGNISGNYFFGNGSQLTGVVATNIGTLGNLSVTGNVTTGGVLTDNYYYANGTPVPFGITYTAASAPPPSPRVADQWYDTDNDVLYEFLNDGTSEYWVDTNSPAFAGGVVANVAISGNMLPVANVTFNIGNSSAYFNTAFLQTASVAGNVVAGVVRSDTVVASILANTTAINLQTNGTNALSVDSNQYITTYRRFAASSMPLGSVIQTVMSSTLGGSVTNSTSYADIGYATLTITPSSATSKILILATGTTSFTPVAGSNVTADTQLVRSPTISLQIQNVGSNIAGGGIGGAGGIAYSYMDSPGTTSPVTYKLQQKISNASSTLTSTNIWIILQEIAA